MSESSNGTGNGPVPPALAVSVIMLRSRAGLTEVFVQNRSATMDFAAGMIVFPGGRVDERDIVSQRADPHPAHIISRHAVAWRETSIGGAGDESYARAMSGALASAACREVFEETGALLAASDFHPWANWTTPPDRPKRFDTYFYLARPSAGTEPRHQTSEAIWSRWLPIREILMHESAGRLKLMRPTLTLLRELNRSGSVEGLPWAGRNILPVRPN